MTLIVGVDRMAPYYDSLSIKATNKLLPPPASQPRPQRGGPCLYVCMATLRHLLINYVIINFVVQLASDAYVMIIDYSLQSLEDHMNIVYKYLREPGYPQHEFVKGILSVHYHHMAKS